MKERPILFSAPMVRALLDGTKTQTRRVCKPAANLSAVVACQDPATYGEGQRPPYITPGWFGDEEGDVQFFCPYGQPGDRLWVREAWAAHKDDDPLPPRYCRRDVRFYEVEHGQQRGLNPRIGKKRPSMFMPRWHSRITLEVTGVRVERLQDISNEDARAEGVMPDYADQCASLGHPYNAIPLYRALWQDINGPISWDANPWVWAVTFNRIT